MPASTSARCGWLLLAMSVPWLVITNRNNQRWKIHNCWHSCLITMVDELALAFVSAYGLLQEGDNLLSKRSAHCGLDFEDSASRS